MNERETQHHGSIDPPRFFSHSTCVRGSASNDKSFHWSSIAIEIHHRNPRTHEIVRMSCEQKSTRKSAEMEEEERGEARDKCRKSWRTLDPMVVDRNDNLYTAVRQSLHKVDRVSTRNSFLKNNQETRNRSGVSQESSIGRFSTIKAFFDKNECQEGKGTRSRCKITVMGRLMRKLESWKREQFPDQLTSMGYSSFYLFLLFCG